MIAVFTGGICLTIIFRQCLERPPVVALTSIVIVVHIVVTVFYGFVAPMVDKHNSARPFCNEVLAALDEGDEVYFYGFYRPNIHYYMHRRIPHLQFNVHVVEALKSAPRAFLIFQRKDKAVLDLGIAEKQYRIEEFTEAKIGSRDIICVIAYPPDAPN
jgi:hypothetical protein